MAIEKWEIDSSHSGIHFSVRHMVVARVRGQFARWTGTVLAEDGDLSRGTVEVVIDASSIDTGVADRDKHLKSADFFDVERFPELTFKGRGTRKLNETSLRLTGDLTIRGVTRTEELRCALDGVATGGGLVADATLSRRAYGVGVPRGLRRLDPLFAVIGDDVRISIRVVV